MLHVQILAALAITAAPITVKMGTIAPEDSPWHEALVGMGQEWSRISGGGVTLRIYASGVLGDETDMVKKMRIGQLHALALSGAGLEHLEPEVACLQLPLMIGSYEELDYVRDRIAPKLQSSIEAKGYVVLNWSDAGWVHFFTKTPARLPDEVRRMKLFTSASDARTLEIYKAAGFRPVPLAVTDILTGLQTGMIDAFDVPPLFALLNQWFPMAPYMLDMKWAPLVGATVISRKVWDRVPAAERAQMLEAGRQAGANLSGRVRKLNDDAIAEMQKRGLKVVPLDEVAKQAWDVELQKAWGTLRGPYCPPATFDEVKRLRDEFRAQRGKR